MSDRINRRAVVERHRITHSAVDAESPLSVGNGEFCFTADATGLQTFGDWHSRAASREAGRSSTPLGTQAQWAFHWAPNEAGHELDDTLEQFEAPDGSLRQYPTAYDWRLSEAEARRIQAAGYYFWVNPQRLHLGRVAYVLTRPSTGERIADPSGLDDVEQQLELWNGLLDSAFSVEGKRTVTQTAVHPTRDVLAVRAQSQLFASGDARLRISFATVDDSWEADEDWGRPDAHTTSVEILPDGVAHITRLVDGARYHVRLAATGARFEPSGRHALDILPLPDARSESDGTDLGGVVELVVEFAQHAQRTPLPSADTVFAESAEHWRSFWGSGAFVDFSSSTDPRAAELERRVVLSQYLTAIQCSGSLPPQESGLVCNSWGGTFHLEMHWWHAAHFALWGRPELLERSLGWYGDILPVARANARRNGYRGARWPKHVGPEGIESPNEIGPLLVWQQPHPIHFAELIYQARDADSNVLDRYGELVDETAEFLADVLWWENGEAHLAPPLMPAQERYDSATTWDPTFELAYVEWALGVACEWRRRRGLEVPEAWIRGAAAIVAPSVSADGRYDAVRGASELIDHPSLLGALGFVPPTRLIDPAVMNRTLDWVLESWEWKSTWGWDFPLVAMCATRLDRLDVAFDSLLSPLPRNRFIANGHNFQVANRLPLYLPGNGGLLAAVAMVLTDADGSPRANLPDGWNAQIEGFARRP